MHVGEGGEGAGPLVVVAVDEGVHDEVGKRDAWEDDACEVGHGVGTSVFEGRGVRVSFFEHVVDRGEIGPFHGAGELSQCFHLGVFDLEVEPNCYMVSNDTSRKSALTYSAQDHRPS
jgi:hypothetical protein